MPDTGDTSDKTDLDQFPDDAIPAHEAARMAVCSAKTLMRRAGEGAFRAWKRDGYKSQFYSAAEIRAWLARTTRRVT